MKHTSSALLATLSLLALSCSDDDDKPRSFTSGVSVNAPVATLSTDDQARLCRSYGAHVSSSVGYELLAQAVCLPQAILLGGGRQGCERRLDECMKDVPPPLRIDAQVADTQVCSEDLAECRLSVGELEACINLRLDWVYDLVRSLSCASAGDPDTRAKADSMMGASVCIAGHLGCERFINVESEPVLF